MRILGIRIENFLSFRQLEWPHLDPSLNLIVGANGSGKTNLFHALRTVVATLDPGQRALWQGATHQGAPGPGYRITLDVEFGEGWEQELLTTFVAAALCNEQQGYPGMTALAGEKLRRFATFVRKQLGFEQLSWLFKGCLIVEYQGDQWWSIRYQSLPESDHSFYSVLESYFEPQALSKSNTPPQGGSASFYGTWWEALDPGEQEKFEAFLNDSASTIQGLPVPDPYRMLDFLEKRGQGLMLQVQQPMHPPLPTHQAFERSLGTTLNPNQTYTLHHVFRALLQRAFVFSDNVRLTPKRDSVLAELSRLPVDFASGELLSRYLFVLKNGDQKERKRYSEIQATFRQLTHRGFDVGVDRASLSASQSKNPDGSDISVVPLTIDVTSDWIDVPLSFSGAGIGEALFLSAVIAGSDGRVVLLDEPAANLHPTMQTSLLSAIQAQASNQFLLVTHSPAMMPSSAILKTTRLYANNGETRRAALDSLEETQRSAIEQELRQSSDARALLFSNGVILVEGETELGALPVWFEQVFHYTFEERDIALYSVGSDTNFEKYVRLLEGFHVPWVIVCDGQAYFKPKGGKTILTQLQAAGVQGLPELSESDFMTLRDELEKCRVFTVATVPEKGAEGIESFDDLPLVKERWKEARDHTGSRSKPRKGHYIAETYPCPREVRELLIKVSKAFDLPGPATAADLVPA